MYSTFLGEATACNEGFRWLTLGFVTALALRSGNNVTTP